MKTKNMFWAALSMTAALVMTACSSDDNMMTPAAPQGEVKTIPYSVTVNEGAATNRATVDSDMKTLKFAAGDKLYIAGIGSRTDVYGTLTLKSGDEGKTSGATFEGTLNYSGDEPASNAELRAVLVGSNNKGVQITSEGKVKDLDILNYMSYPYTAYCATVDEAVEQYSNLTATSTYGAKSFSLTQYTAFLNFEITLENGTASGTTLSADVRSNNNHLCTANVTTTSEGGKVVAKFVLPLSCRTIWNPTVIMGNKDAISFNGKTLDAKVYNVKRTLYVRVTGITLDNQALMVGYFKKLNVTVSPANAHDKTVTWTTNNPAVATVDAEGIVTAVAKGKAKITATANDGSGVTGTCTVTVGDGSGPPPYIEAVDLGLSVKWANMNIGAESESDYGLFYAWGETTGYSAGISDLHNFNWTSYNWSGDTEKSLTKYNTKAEYGTVDNKTTLDAADDVALVSWGSPWRMPTAEECRELLNNTNREWVANYNNSGVSGCKFINKNDATKYIFLPTPGFRNLMLYLYAGKYGGYWSSSLDTSNPSCGYELGFLYNSDNIGVNSNERNFGISVRAVQPY